MSFAKAVSGRRPHGSGVFSGCLCGERGLEPEPGSADARHADGIFDLRIFRDFGWDDTFGDEITIVFVLVMIRGIEYNVLRNAET